MKEGWTTKKIGEIAKICLGLTHTPKYVENGVPFISVKDISSGRLSFKDTKYISREEFKEMPDGAKPQKGDLLFCRVGTIGKPQIIETDIEFGIFVSVGFLRIMDESLTKYTKYWMESPLFFRQVSDNVQGSTLKNLNTGWLKNFKINIPPRNEIDSITSRLDSAFAKIDAMKANAEKALNEAKALFQASLKEMLEPKEGWEEKKFGKLCDFVRGPFGGSLKKECFKDSGYAVYEQQNAIYNKFSFRYYIDEEKYQSLIRFKVNSGDLIMSCSGTIGKVAIIPEGAKDGIINQALLKLTPNKDVDAHFLKYLMESNYFKEIINANIEGVAIKNIASVAVLKEIKLYIPKVNEQQNIVLEIDSLKSKVDRLQENYDKISQECDALKQAILRQVFE